jgi:tetratricopeptide (TPR) repeat protein
LLSGTPTGYRKIPMTRSSPVYLFALLLLCFCLCITAANAAPEAGLLTAAGDTQGPPPKEVDAYVASAQAAVAIRDWPEVLIITTRGLAWYPDNADLHCLQGYSYRKMGQYQKSVDAISRGILIDPKPVRFGNRGYGYLALGNSTAALADAQEGIRLDASSTTSYGVGALALHGLGRDEEALAMIDTAIGMDPQSAHSRHVKGIILTARGDCAGARAALEESLALDPDYSLPWPGFPSTQESRDALPATCPPAQDGQSPAQSPVGWAAFVAVVAIVAWAGMRR